jgi:hypothetical protein
MPVKGVGVTPLEKLLDAVANAPANTRFDTLVRLMEAAGFRLRMGKRGHAIFIHRAYHILQNVAVPHHGPVKPVYVRECLKAIEKLQLLRGSTNA